MYQTALVLFFVFLWAISISWTSRRIEDKSNHVFVMSSTRLNCRACFRRTTDAACWACHVESS